MAHSKHAEVRARYGYRCGYCGVSETDTGGELAVDHFHPVSAGGGDDDQNLVYACFRCNSYKADYCPTESNRHRGLVLLHPLSDDPARHVRLHETTGQLEPLTATGRFHVLLLHLNRPALVEMRLRRRDWELQQARQHLLEDQVRELRAILAAQERYLDRLKRQLSQ